MFQFGILNSTKIRTHDEITKREMLKSAVFNLVVNYIAKRENIKVTYLEILDEIEKHNDFYKEKYEVLYTSILIDKECLTNYQIVRLKEEILRKNHGLFNRY